MVKFTEDEAKVIADFYFKNYKIFTSSQHLPAVNKQRHSKYQELVSVLNANNPDTPKTFKEVKEKIQSLRKGAKKKSTSNTRERKKTGGGKGKKVQLSSAEEVFAANLGAMPAFAGLKGGIESATAFKALQRVMRDADDDSDSDDDGNSDGDSNGTLESPIFKPVSQDDPFEMEEDKDKDEEPAPIPDATESKNCKKIKCPEKKMKSDLAAQQQRILDLQEKVLENQMKATNEFRECMVEFRVAMRHGPLKDTPMTVAEDLVSYATSFAMDSMNQ